MNRSRIFWLFDRAFISGVALPTALVVISVPPGAGTNSLAPVKVSCAKFGDRTTSSGQTLGTCRDVAAGAGGFVEMDAKPSWQGSSPLRTLPALGGIGFAESRPFCDSKLCGASCAQPFAATVVRTIAWTANSLNSLLTILPPIPTEQSDVLVRKTFPRSEIL